MKKSLLYTLFAGTVVFGVVSCEKNNLVIDQDVTPPSFAKFNTNLAADTTATFYINSSNNSIKLPIGVTTVSDKDRTIQLTYTSKTAAQGAQYTAPTSIVIPAGKAIDTLTIKGLFAGYPTSARRDTVKITISGGDIPASSYKNSYTLIMRKYCDVVVSSIAGTYTASVDRYGSSNYGPYTVNITNVTPVTATTATAKIQHLAEAVLDAPSPSDPINVVLDWTDPANFKITIPANQLLYSGDYYGDGPITIVGQASTFSSCDKTFTLNYSLRVAAGSYGNFTTTIK